MIAFSPVIVGAFRVIPDGLAACALTLFGAYAFARTGFGRAQKVATVLLALCFGLTLSELIARPILYYFFDIRPADRFLYPWPPLPQLHRYMALVNFEGETYGDLAAAAARPEWRDTRRIRFLTDAYGFRNDPSTAGSDPRPFDAIVLGDSFGVAASTTQEATLSSVLARDYHLHVYNLSISRENPRQEYANLALEHARLTTTNATSVLWLIFPGNDLDEPYDSELDHPQPVWPGLLSRLETGFTRFRSRAALRRLVAPRGSSQVVEKRFLDGRRLLLSAPYAEHSRRTIDDIRRHPNFRSLEATLDAMRRLAIASQLNIAVVVVPSKEEVYSWVFNDAPPWSSALEPSSFSVLMRQMCEQRHFRFLDLKPALVEASRTSYERADALLWWNDDSHWNDQGQRVAAEAIYANLFR